MKIINDKTIESTHVEWAVAYVGLDNEKLIYEADDEGDARWMRDILGGTVLAREAYVTAYAEVSA